MNRKLNKTLTNVDRQWKTSEKDRRKNERQTEKTEKCRMTCLKVHIDEVNIKEWKRRKTDTHTPKLYRDGGRGNYSELNIYKAALCIS